MTRSRAVPPDAARRVLYGGELHRSWDDRKSIRVTVE
jgi:hypothetical protein